MPWTHFPNTANSEAKNYNKLRILFRRERQDLGYPEAIMWYSKPSKRGGFGLFTNTIFGIKRCISRLKANLETRKALWLGYRRMRRTLTPESKWLKPTFLTYTHRPVPAAYASWIMAIHRVFIKLFSGREYFLYFERCGFPYGQEGRCGGKFLPEIKVSTLCPLPRKSGFRRCFCASLPQCVFQLKMAWYINCWALDGGSKKQM